MPTATAELPEPQEPKLPAAGIVWDEDVPTSDDEEPLDLFLARHLLRSRYGDFTPLLTGYVLVASYEDEDGAKGVACTASKHTHYVMDRGMLETALYEYRALGAVQQLPDCEEDD